eukprot:5338683-Lingulodinium_polyedra.AAC.1
MLLLELMQDRATPAFFTLTVLDKAKDGAPGWFSTQAAKWHLLKFVLTAIELATRDWSDVAVREEVRATLPYFRTPMSFRKALYPEGRAPEGDRADTVDEDTAASLKSSLGPMASSTFELFQSIYDGMYE